MKLSKLNISNYSNNSFSEGDYLAANMIIIFKTLKKKNNVEMKDVINFLNKYDIDSNHESVNMLIDKLENRVNNYLISKIICYVFII